jgi:hypothetical protein
VLSESLNANFESILTKLPKQSAVFLQSVATIEHEQETFWYSNVCGLARSAGLRADVDAILFLDQMTARTTKLIQDHLFPASLGYSTLFRLVISGPPRSGKTTFFGVFVEQFLLSLIACGLWKRTCIFILNGGEIAQSATDPKKLYLKVVDVVITAVATQVPSFTVHMSMLVTFFGKVVESRMAPVLPKCFIVARETQALAKACITLAERLKAAWHNPDAGIEWAQLLFQFPLLLAKEIGFDDVFFFIDNFDCLNQILDAESRFRSRDIHLGECIKRTLSKSQFVLSYRSEREFENCIIPLERRVMDFPTDLEYCSTLDLDCDPPFANNLVVVDFGEELVLLTPDYFGGAPGYLKQWHFLNQLLEDMEVAREDEKAADDFMAEAFTHTGKVLQLVFHTKHPFGEIKEVRWRKA